MWLEFIGVVSGCCCKEVRIYVGFFIILLSPTPLVLALFLQQHPYFFIHLFNVFLFVLVYVIFVQYSKSCSKNIRDR